MARYDVILLGSASCDLIFGGMASLPKLGEELWTKEMDMMAGGMINSAAAMSRLGLRTGLAVEIGSDVWGELILSELRKEGVGLEFIRQYPYPYPQVTVVLNHAGDRTFISYSDRRHSKQFTEELVDVVRNSDASIYHITAQPEYANLIADVRKMGKSISLDTVWDEDWLVSDEIRELIRFADMFMPNLKEAQAITGKEDPLEALELLAELAPVVIIKLGEKGAIGKYAGQVYRRTVRSVKQLDATGAGDCFAAGFIYGWLQRRDFGECLEIANFCGSCSVEKVGGYSGAPTLKELELAIPNRK
ncbi:carbohydrate kinase family protein [Paenibacillus sp. GCM10027628]|uniref:carbohydrate kinase family protein n=1 Tax=Paenibacillus sp. GCM10027628 TaxID=3273413 RepID=UPI00363DC5E6